MLSPPVTIIRTKEGYERTFSEFDETIGIELLAAFHLNDSKKEFHSRVDRHEHIGKGFIGVEAFRLLMNDKRFWGLPMCLETPKGPDLKEDRENLTLLRSLIEVANRNPRPFRLTFRWREGRVRARTLSRNRNPREKPLHDETDQITQARGAHRDHEKFTPGNQHATGRRAGL